jgi:hypothetical protein
VQEKVQMTDFIKEHLMQLLRSRTETMQHRLATSLAHLLTSDDLARAYATYGGGAVLLEMVVSPHTAMHDTSAWDAALEALVIVVRLCQERETSHSTSFVPAPPEEKVRAPPPPALRNVVLQQPAFRCFPSA